MRKMSKEIARKAAKMIVEKQLAARREELKAARTEFGDRLYAQLVDQKAAKLAAQLPDGWVAKYRSISFSYEKNFERFQMSEERPFPNESDNVGFNEHVTPALFERLEIECDELVERQIALDQEQMRLTNRVASLLATHTTVLAAAREIPWAKEALAVCAGKEEPVDDTGLREEAALLAKDLGIKT